MHRIIVLLFYFFFGISSMIWGQGNNEFSPSSLQISWELMDNHHRGNSQFLARLTLVNNGNNPIPESGWSLYVNNMFCKDQTGNFDISHVNGDLDQMAPIPSFDGLIPGETLNLDLICTGSALNITGAPIGFYWVWDSNKENGIPIKQYTVEPVDGPEVLDRGPGDHVSVATPENVYEWNNQITDLDENQLPKVFPTPNQYRERNGSFSLTSDVSIKYISDFRNEAEYFSSELEKILGSKPTMTTENVPGKEITLQKTNTEPEGYELSVTPQAITISASDAAGIFYGIQSLKTAMPPTAWSGPQQSVAIPALEVTDAPRFGYRAFMQDVARNFRSKEQILKTLDLMSLYKLNVFHFHFNDDEGWRIEIPDLPELTEVGAQRGHTLDNHERLQPSHGSGPNSTHPGSGYYSTEDFIDILEYATERHIRVIPEIETPGHARAAIKSMDARYRRLMEQGKEEQAKTYLLRDLEDTSEYESVQGWDDNVINVALPSTYRFLGKVIDELQAMYNKAGAPLERIHMGGDEVPAGVWEKSPAVQTLISENPEVESTGDLWGYFYRRVDDMLKERGLKLYGWEEIGMKDALWGGESHSVADTAFAKEDVQVDVWNNVTGSGDEDLAYRLANAGYKVVLSGVSNFYFDLAYQKEFAEPGLYWGGFNSLEKPFEFIPYDYYKNADADVMGRPLNDNHFEGMERLTEEGRANIVGIQSLLWGEKLISDERQEYMLVPKLLAMAERAWAEQPEWAQGEWTIQNEQQYQQAWSTFLNIAAKRELPRLDHYAGGFRYRIPTPGAIIKDGTISANVQMPGFTIRYTTDGSEPDINSKIYAGPINASSAKLRVFSRNGRGGRTVEISK
ncbi:carbohydate-binding domain-containing protein [Aliifodinibius sp. S!AR15-10]|uniref:family 20 glycosylhydrolase n=1 Tax=Aliifodinibius sp. S!AR15-10 TaxID=2950437 RepID=UPI00286071A5|nr:family 20 glycosylhydrolase [Aliifodinibius sp. S!AR15-10]MDR8391086.1 carbohydate-binding domain-containing protein [Aliifodinibius sp. S!AR15-10]